MENNYNILATDGACSKNGSTNALAGYGIVFCNKNTKWNISEKLCVEGASTNNKAELIAIQKALETLLDHKHEIYDNNKNILIASDSSYSIKCLTIWHLNWKKNNWINSKKEPVKNKDIIEKCLNLIKEVEKKYKLHIKFKHIRGHQKIPPSDELDYICWKYNLIADELAVKGCSKK